MPQMCVPKYFPCVGAVTSTDAGLVNARHTKNLPGRKSDVQESQWLLKLHTYGLLNNSFQPTSDIRVKCFMDFANLVRVAPGVAVDQLHQFGAVHLSEVRMLRDDGVKSVAAFLHQLNAAVPRRLKFSEGRAQRAQATSRLRNVGRFHFGQAV